MICELAPIAVYTYNRLHHLRQTVDALRHNFLASASVLYVVSDAPKRNEDRPYVNGVRNYLDGIEGFREIVRLYRPVNLGTPASIHEAERQIIGDHGTVISMEDDNVSSPNYLNFMNDGLKVYRDVPHIFSICGYCPPIPIPAASSTEYFLYPWNLSWGYAMWKHKYDKIYPLRNDYHAFANQGLLRRVRRAGGVYITDALRRDFQRKAIFPDAVLCTKMTREGMWSVIPTLSKIRNIGSDGSGVSGSRLAGKYEVALDDRPVTSFSFAERPPINDYLVSQAVRFYSGSLCTRLSMRLGIYHELAQIKKQVLRCMKAFHEGFSL